MELQTIRRRPHLGNRKFLTDEEVIAAVHEHGGSTKTAARALGCHHHTLMRYRARLGIANPVGCPRWDAAAIEKLIAMVTATPRPSNEEIAKAFGVTVNAIQTAMSRYGITKRSSGNTLLDLSVFKQRRCLTCRNPFLSDGAFRCRRCNRREA
jgi:transposase-like protein